MNLVALPAFSDNYIWMLHNGREALVVDPGDAAPVEAALESLQLRLTGILVTHHHPDHVGGLVALSQRLEGPIWGPGEERLPVEVVPVGASTRLTWGGRSIQVMELPGHTAGHRAYWINALPGPATTAGDGSLVFCGDTLFSGGCGRVFEGTMEQMFHSLRQLADLPADTLVCCAHEYTLSNLRFAREVEPGNAELLRYSAHCEALRAQSKPTVPSGLAQELAINPFLRCDQPEIAASARRHKPDTPNDPVAIFRTLREWKNTYR